MLRGLCYVPLANTGDQHTTTQSDEGEGGILKLLGCLKYMYVYSQGLVFSYIVMMKDMHYA